jgi:class 3 adenylate cyclase
VSKINIWWNWHRGSDEKPYCSNSKDDLLKYQEKVGFSANSVSLTEQNSLLKITKDGDAQVMKKAVKATHDRCRALLQSLEGKTIRITALNVDIVNSTAKVKTLSCERAAEYYRTFIENTSELMQYYGGYVLKNVGDCVIGFFPCSHYIVENHDKAVLCGLAIRGMIKDLLEPYLAEKKLPSIACRVSADFGSAKVLRIRSNGGYSTIDLFGSAINSTCKISRYAKPNSMVIGDNLFWQLINTDGFIFKPVNHFDLTGKHSYPVYTVESK